MKFDVRIRMAGEVRRPDGSLKTEDDCGPGFVDVSISTATFTAGNA